MARFPESDLIMKALLALEEGAELLRLDRAEPTLALRFALAYLFDVGTGEQSIFDGYWAGITGKAGRAQASDYMSGVVRRTSVETALAAIWRSVGVERTVGELQRAQAAVRRARPELSAPAGSKPD